VFALKAAPLADAVIVDMITGETADSAHAVFIRPVVSLQYAARCVTGLACAVLVRPVVLALKATGLAHTVVVNMPAGETASAAHAVFLRPVMSVQYAARCVAGLACAVLI
jgi:hypothetical protein